jgi:hypothetical protein
MPWTTPNGWVGKDLCAGPSTMAMDIKPGSCDNPVNVKSQGVLPVVILGTEHFSVATIDVDSLTLAGVAPIRSEVFDVLTSGETGDCNEMGGDGFPDLVLKFESEDIVAALGDVQDGAQVELALTGALIDGTSFTGADTILILKKGKVENPKGPETAPKKGK